MISVASPIGKVAIDRPWGEHLERFKIAVDTAEFFGAPFIRVFSYYPAGGEGKARSTRTATRWSTASAGRWNSCATGRSRSCTRTRRGSSATSAGGAST